jgi:hypothetical protein
VCQVVQVPEHRQVSNGRCYGRIRATRSLNTRAAFWPICVCCCVLCDHVLNKF